MNNADNEYNAVNAGGKKMFILMILEQIKKTSLKFSQGSVTVLYIMANYQEAVIKVTNFQLNKLKSAPKHKTGTTLKNKSEKLWRWRIVTWIIFNNKTKN